MAGPGGRLDAVLVCGGRWHDFDYARYQLLGLLGEREQVRTQVFPDYGCVAALERADLVVSYTCDVRPSAAEQDASTRRLRRSATGFRAALRTRRGASP